MLLADTFLSSGNGVAEFAETAPSFEVVKEIPSEFSKQIEEGVKDFIKSSHIGFGVDAEGFYHQTLEAIANATYLHTGGEFWLGVQDNQVVTYILASFNKNIDGKLCYWVSQAWVRKDQRGKPWVKWAWEKLRQRAKDCFCKHVVVISSRENDDVYCRFLGEGFHKYATILKEEI